MDIRKMDDDEAAEFLSQPHVAVLAVDEPGWPPHVTPVWFGHDRAANRFWVMTDASTKKARLHGDGSGDLSLCVESTEGVTARYVNVQGHASLQPLSPEVLESIAAKYLPPEFSAAYVADPPEDSMFEITPRRIVTGVIG